MKKVGQVFHSFAESEEANRRYYQSLIPEQRMDILLNLIQQAQGDEAEQGFERVYRIVKLQES